LIFHVIT